MHEISTLYLLAWFIAKFNICLMTHTSLFMSLYPISLVEMYANAHSSFHLSTFLKSCLPNADG